jgi:hypothetical protein
MTVIKKGDIRHRLTISVTCCIVILTANVDSFPWGAPQLSCNECVPGHGGALPQSNANIPFEITTDKTVAYTEYGSTLLPDRVKITLKALNPDTPFLGFLLQIRNESTGAPTGRFTKIRDDCLLMNCNGLNVSYRYTVINIVSNN